MPRRQLRNRSQEVARQTNATMHTTHAATATTRNCTILSDRTPRDALSVYTIRVLYYRFDYLSLESFYQAISGRSENLINPLNKQMSSLIRIRVLYNRTAERLQQMQLMQYITHVSAHATCLGTTNIQQPHTKCKEPTGHGITLV